jgi:hypothetical protein
MAMTVVSTSEGRYAILEADLPGPGTTAIGVLLQDPSTDQLHIRLRDDWEVVAGEDAEVFEALQGDLISKAEEVGAEQLFAWLEDSLSNTVRISDRQAVLVGNFDRTLNRLYAQHIQSTRAVIPRWTLKVAAGHFLDNSEVEPDGYEEAPAEIRSSQDLFAAQIVGTSMEPVIPNGSVCLFRKFGAGSRQGKLVLVEELGRGANDRYTVKRYTSAKRQGQDGGWEHNLIRLEPLNPEHQAWDLDPEEERYRIVAEFVKVLY